MKKSRKKTLEQKARDAEQIEAEERAREALVDAGRRMDHPIPVDGLMLHVLHLSETRDGVEPTTNICGHPLADSIKVAEPVGESIGENLKPATFYCVDCVEGLRKTMDGLIDDHNVLVDKHNSMADRLVAIQQISDPGFPFKAAILTEHADERI